MFVRVGVLVVRTGLALSASAADRSADFADAALHQGADDAQQHSTAHAGRRRATTASRRTRQTRGIAQ